MIELPKPIIWRNKQVIQGYTAEVGDGPWYSADQMLGHAHRAVEADRASRQGPLEAAVETLQKLGQEIDGGWTPEAVEHFRKLGPLLKMAST